MKYLKEVALILQSIGTSTAVIFNAFLIYIIVKYTKMKMGFYKNVLIMYSLFEILYAIVVFLGMPVHYISKRTWVGFNYYGPLSDTSFAILGPTLYCFFYELWLGFCNFQFIYREIATTRKSWSQKIKKSSTLQGIIWTLFFSYILLCLFCSQYMCTVNQITPDLLEDIYREFELDNQTKIAYYVQRTRNLDGSYSFMNIAAIGVHYFCAYGSLLIIGICSWRIWSCIQKQLEQKQNRDTQMAAKLEKQLFLNLLLQASVPIMTCHLPSVFVLSYPFQSEDLSIWKLTPLFSVFTTLPKAIDPIITIFCIRQYRLAVAEKLGCCWKRKIGVSHEQISAIPSTQFQTIDHH